MMIQFKCYACGSTFKAKRKVELDKESPTTVMMCTTCAKKIGLIKNDN